mmetsp:Transcript_106230/g.298744  ORF Transcript_106230/g.298744 Transcript_106230/m.298744 type:complete len:237 (-) Transcript_106230:2-712(-)
MRSPFTMNRRSFPSYFSSSTSIPSVSHSPASPTTALPMRNSSKVSMSMKQKSPDVSSTYEYVASDHVVSISSYRFPLPRFFSIVAPLSKFLNEIRHIEPPRPRLCVWNSKISAGVPSIRIFTPLLTSPGISTMEPRLATVDSRAGVACGSDAPAMVPLAMTGTPEAASNTAKSRPRALRARTAPTASRPSRASVVCRPARWRTGAEKGRTQNGMAPCAIGKMARVRGGQPREPLMA